MNQDSVKTSLLIPSQLPEYIRDDPSYNKFVAFLQAYYEWMEKDGGVSYHTKNLLSYKDIDETSSQFLDYYYNDFLSYFPAEILSDKRKVTKLARQLYQAKGSPASFQFLFRLLYNTDVDFFNTKDAVLKASAGKWYIAKSLKLSTDDINFLNINNLKIFGETSKSVATIETSIFAGNKIEVFISNIERLFQSGEYVTVLDSNNQPVYFLNGKQVSSDVEGSTTLRAKIVGQISQIKINPIARGLLYEVGDPVVVYGGLSSPTGIGAEAVVSETTTGSINNILVTNGGFGYREDPNTIISITNAPGAVAKVGTLNPSANGYANVSIVPINYIGKKINISIGANTYNFSGLYSANANTRLVDAFSFISFDTYPISSLVVTNGGGGVSQIPSISASSVYPLEDEVGNGYIKNLGILGPIQIVNAGVGYQSNDKIIISGGTGSGAFANVINVAANGAIVNVSYVYNSTFIYPLGGMGYKKDTLPSLTVSSANANASGASLVVTGILGDGATFTPSVDRVGSITSISVTNYGEDYVSAPSVSLKIEDIVVKGLVQTDLPQRGDVVYQGASTNTSTYLAYVDSISSLVSYATPTDSLYVLRVYNYNSYPNISNQLNIDGKDIVMNMTNEYNTLNPFSKYDTNGVYIYGDGTAKANATFLNGLTIGQGQYLDDSHQPSSFSVLQSDIYNNYTYQITLEKEIAKYRDTLLGLLHPTGMKVLGRYAMKSNSSLVFSAYDELEKGYPLSYYTGTNGSYVTMSTDWSTYSNNVIQFNYLAGADITQFIFANDYIKFETANGDFVTSKVISVTGGSSNTVVIQDNVWLTFANVAYVSANAGANQINIISLTNSYDYINGGVYSDEQYPIRDIVRVGDKVLIANNTERTVTSVDFTNNIVYVNSNISSNVSNSFISVNRTLISYDGDVKIIGPEGVQFLPQLTTEDNLIITTENDLILVLD